MARLARQPPERRPATGPAPCPRRGGGDAGSLRGAVRGAGAWASAAFALALLGSAGCGTEAPAAACTVSKTKCVGPDVWRCDSATGAWSLEQSCTLAGLDCLNGQCIHLTGADVTAADTVTDGQGGPADVQGATDAAQAQDAPTSADAPGPADIAPADAGLGPDPDVVQDSGPAVDAAPGVDGGVDAAPDGVGDAAADAGLDTGPDAAPDIGWDAGVDAGPVGQPDAGADGGAPPDAAPSDPYKPGFLIYERVTNLLAKDDLLAVCWHPSGDWAVVLGRSGQVLRYDVPGALSKVATLGVETVAVAVAADGSAFLIIGRDKALTGQLWRLDVSAQGKLGAAVATKIGYGIPVDIQRAPSGTFAVGTRDSKGSIGYLFTYTLIKGLSAPKGFNAYGGMTGLMWGSDGLPMYGGSEIVVTAHGVNGADSKTWLLATGDVLANGWKASFGNAGRAGWRPGGAFGFVNGTSSNKVYVYDGAWTAATMPGAGGHTAAIGWKPDGTRALAVGRASGAALAATVIEYRAGLLATQKAYVPSGWVDASIPDFSKTPWFANSSTWLNGVAWRPGGGCDEGLIAAADTGSASSPTFGLLIRFYDSGDPACAPLK